MIYRVSNVEAFRQWRDEEDADIEVLRAKLRGDFEPSTAMLAGTAFHKALEVAKPGDTDTLEAMGYTFHISADVELCLPAIRELRASKAYIVDDRPIVISGQLDALVGRRIEDHKTTGRFDPERYLSGYQWRLYLDIFDADVFRWNVFEIAEADHAQAWEVWAAHRLEQYRYPGLGADCLALVSDFARFVRQEEAIREPAEA